MFPSEHERSAFGAAVPTLLQASLIPLSIRRATALSEDSHAVLFNVPDPEHHTGLRFRPRSQSV